MTTEQVIDEIRKLIARHVGDERELYEELLSETEGWSERLELLEAMAGDEGDE